jgi:phasin family protein
MEAKARRSPRAAAPADPEIAVEAVETAAVPLPTPEPLPTLPPPATPSGGDPLAALMESQAAVARGLTALSAELALLAQGGIDAASRNAGDLLSAKTLADAIEINTGFARHSFEALLSGSARLSEIGVRLAAEASRPIIAQFNRDWSKAAP